MPKISVHLEADSAEEFRALLSALYATVPMTGVTAGWAAQRSLPEAHEPVSDVRFADGTTPLPSPTTPIGAVSNDQMLEVMEAREEYSEPVTLAPATEPPVTAKKVGRPRKAQQAPEVPVEPAVAPAPVPPAAAPAGNGTGATATRQDLLDVFAEYVQRYGANFGYTDISGLLQKTFGEGVRKASDVPETALAQAISAIRTAIADNPFNRKRDYA